MNRHTASSAREPLREGDNETGPEFTVDDEIVALKGLFYAFQSPPAFALGDLVTIRDPDMGWSGYDPVQNESYPAVVIGLYADLSTVDPEDLGYQGQPGVKLARVTEEGGMRGVSVLIAPNWHLKHFEKPAAPVEPPANSLPDAQ